MESNPKFASLASDEAIETAAAALREHGFAVEIAADGAAAKARVLAIVPKGAEVMTMSSTTLEQTGIRKEIEESGRYAAARKKLTDPKTPEKEKKTLGYAADWVLGSAHAVTEEGSVLVASNTGSQLGAYAYGAGKVVFVVGTQKIVKDEAEGLRRIEEYCLPLEDARAQKAYGMHSAANEILVMRKQRDLGRVTMILVKEKVGF